MKHMQSLYEADSRCSSMMQNLLLNVRSIHHSEATSFCEAMLHLPKASFIGNRVCPVSNICGLKVYVLSFTIIAVVDIIRNYENQKINKGDI